MANRDAASGQEETPGEVGVAEGCRASTAVGRYANFFKIGHNALEVVIEFGESYTDELATPIHTRIVTHPVYARALLALLDDSMVGRGHAADVPAGARRESKAGT